MKITSAPDLATLSAIHTRCFAQGWDVEAFAGLFAIEGTHALLAQGDEGVGVLRVLGGEAEILTFAVLPEHRRQGIGKAIVAAMLDFARREGAKSVFLEVRAGNTAAQALYAAAGFNVISTRRDYYDNADGSSEHAIVMRRML